MSVNEGGRSRRFGKLKYQDLLQKNAEVEATIQNVFGRNMAYSQEGANVCSKLNKHQSTRSSRYQTRVWCTSYVPPTNRLGGALQYC